MIKELNKINEKLDNIFRYAENIFDLIQKTNNESLKEEIDFYCISIQTEINQIKELTEKVDKMFQELKENPNDELTIEDLTDFYEYMRESRD